MMKFTSAVLLGIYLFGSADASAEDLRPMQGSSIVLGPMSGVAYYTEDAGTYRVVATLAAGPEYTPVRVIATLLPDQAVTLSVPGPVGAPGISVQLARRGNRLVVISGDAKMLPSLVSR